MKSLLLFLTILTAGSGLQAQDAETEIRAAVNLLFEGMKSADAAKVRSAFSDSAILQTIVHSADGKLVVRNEKIADFSAFVATQKPDSLDERIQFGAIHIDGPLAVVWTPYRFYYKGRFSHCGVNSFQMVHLQTGWKIQYLIDTRRREGCE